MARSRTLAQTVGNGYRALLAASAAVVLVIGSLLAWLILVSRPSIARYDDGRLQLDRQFQSMLDEETGVRGYLGSGRDVFLQPYREAAAQLPRIDRSLTTLTREPAVSTALVRLRLAEQRWVEEWARPALAGARLAGREALSFLTLGKSLFDEYRSAQRTAARLVERQLRIRQDEQERALVLAAAAATALAAAALVGGWVVRRRMQTRIVRPVAALSAGLSAVHHGRLEVDLEPSGPLELQDVMAGFNAMTESLAQARNAARETAMATARQSERRRQLLDVVRLFGESPRLEHVLDAVMDAVTLLAAGPVSLWLREDELSLARRSSLSDPVHAPDVVLRATRLGRPQTRSDEQGMSIALPMTAGGQVIGVVSLYLDAAPTADDLDALETIAVHAATAIAAARLYERVSYASDHDALTRLPNRRRLDEDLAAECARSGRYGNALSLIMLDLDHFKLLNDSFGHQQGDAVLTGVAGVLRGRLRSTDCAYRYGGEELAVLLPETSADQAHAVAELLRSAVEAAAARGAVPTPVTASFGVAELSDVIRTPEQLLNAADQALYAAKGQGRNRVVAAGRRPVVRAVAG